LQKKSGLFITRSFFDQEMLRRLKESSDVAFYRRVH